MALQNSASTALALLSILLCAVGSGLCQQVSVDYSEGLPKGWSAVWDPSNEKHYYWNTLDGETTWNRPWEFDIAELDDPDDLLSGTGIERHDCKLLQDDSIPVWPTAEELAADEAAFAPEGDSGAHTEGAHEQQDAYAYFLSMDVDQDGGLNEEEFMAALRAQSEDPAAWDQEDLTEIQQFFSEKQRRGQPVMTWEEWRMLFSSEEEDHGEAETGGEGWDQQVEAYDEEDYDDGPLTYDEVTFRKYDLDGNGVLDREEVHKMLGRAEALAEVAAAADELLAELDLDEDEAITFSEWVSSLY